MLLSIIVNDTSCSSLCSLLYSFHASNESPSSSPDGPLERHCSAGRQCALRSGQQSLRKLAPGDRKPSERALAVGQRPSDGRFRGRLGPARRTGRYFGLRRCRADRRQEIRVPGGRAPQGGSGTAFCRVIAPGRRVCLPNQPPQALRFSGSQVLRFSGPQPEPAVAAASHQEARRRPS